MHDVPIMPHDRRDRALRLLLDRVAEMEARLVARLDRVERTVEDIADDTDAIDRHLRPYGDGGRRPRGRS